MIKIYYNLPGYPNLVDTNPYAPVSLLEELNNRLVEAGVAISNDFTLEFNILFEKNISEGELAYVFKPFRNLRYNGDNVPGGVSNGELVDFSTKDLNFSINYPVEIETQPSYDGTVNLILTDNFNPPRLINSRFSVTEGRRFYIVDREGNKDTNIYEDTNIDSQTRLYKSINKIPKLEFDGIDNDGKFPVGNYVFYFRLVDADGNETDIITESGIVSFHIGGLNDPKSIRGGMGNENSGKAVKFKFSNLDSSYNFLNVYYSRSTSDYSEKEITQYFKINTKFSVKSTTLDLKITGFENVTTITRDKINLQYNIIDRNKTMAQVQNMLFLANIHKATLPYRELKDLSLRILPFPEQSSGDIGYLQNDYKSTSGKYGYHDSSNVYNFTGYWDEEMYRVAIVYIMNDYSLSDPYNIRGRDFTANTIASISESNIDNVYSKRNIYNVDAIGNRTRNYIEEEEGFISNPTITNVLENSRGVVKIGGASIKSQIDGDNQAILPISVKIIIPDEVREELKTYTKGFFFVRQKRVPTILCQAYSIGHDKASGLPLLPEWVGNKTVHTIEGISIYNPYYNDVVTVNTGYSSIDADINQNRNVVLNTKLADIYRLPAKGEAYFTFVNDDILQGGYSTKQSCNPPGMNCKNVIDQTITISTLLKNLNPGGIFLAPDVIVDSENLTQVLSGSEFMLTPSNFNSIDRGFVKDLRSFDSFPTDKTLEELDLMATNFTISGYKYVPYNLRLAETEKLILVAGDTTSVSQDNVYYSSRAGIPEEAWRFSAFLKKEKELVQGYYKIGDSEYTKESNVLIRGLFTPFIGGVGSIKTSGNFYNIRTLGYSERNVKDYFKFRFEDNAPFMAISDRFSWERFVQEASSLATHKYINIYRGDCFVNQVSIRMLRNFQDPESPINDIIVDHDTIRNFTGYKDVNSGTLQLNKDNIDKINRGDINAVRLGYWATFKFCSNINYAFRCIDPTYTSEYALSGRARSFVPLTPRNLEGPAKIADSTVINVGYNSTTSDKEYFVTPDIPAIKNDFSNRIMYSEIHVNDAFKNGYRIFEGLNFQDYTIDYGTITKIESWFTNLIVIFESGVGIIPINERTLAGTSEGENIYLKNAGVLPEKPLMLSMGIGSTWIDSIVVSKNYIYGVDTVSKKIWRTDGKKFDVFSDFKVQKFLNDNISFTVYDKTPMIGLRNVVGHYNVFKNDVMFTFYDQTFNESEKVWNLCYNEQLNNWVSRLGWTPAFSANISNVFFTFARNTCKVTSMISKSINSTDGIGRIYINSDGEYPLTVGDYLSLFYEKQLEQFVPIITNPVIIVRGDNISGPVAIEEVAPLIFIDGPSNTPHPMYEGTPSNGYDRVWIFTPEEDKLLLVYDKQNVPLALSDNSVMYFYASDNTSNTIESGDILLSTKVNDDLINDILQTTKEKPNLKINFVVQGTPNASIAASMARIGWSFTIGCIQSTLAIVNTTEYFLTLQGKEQYVNPSFSYSLDLGVNTSIYDNQYFKVNNTVAAKLTVNPAVFALDDIDTKFERILLFLDRIYFSFLMDLNVTFGTTTNKLKGSDQFQDSLYIRPSLETLEELLTIFSTLSTCPPLRPYIDVNTPAVYLTESQRLTIVSQVNNTISRFKANTTTNLWKHGQSGIFPHEGNFEPCKWYGEQHPFEFEFVVNGDELGIHKIFDNLKIISNKAQPQTFEYEIVGDAYDFTEDYIDGKLVGGKIKVDGNGNPIYELVPPTKQIVYEKGKRTSQNPNSQSSGEFRILAIQEAKDFNKVGQRLGNMRYKEDMWEVQIQSLKVKKLNTGKLHESKIRDKYCKIRVRYSGTQLSIITALQTLYTLSYA